jgi:hypothetical protein
MVVYMLTNDRQFRCYDFRTTTELLKLYSGQIAASKEKSNLGLFRWDSSLDLNRKRWDTLPAFYRLLIQPHLANGLDVTEF